MQSSLSRNITPCALRSLVCLHRNKAGICGISIRLSDPFYYEAYTPFVGVLFQTVQPVRGNLFHSIDSESEWTNAAALAAHKAPLCAAHLKLSSPQH
ncbi:hypothetical protein WJX79_001394 [Trebouxia sp. C0005]